MDDAAQVGLLHRDFRRRKARHYSVLFHRLRRRGRVFRGYVVKFDAAPPGDVVALRVQP